MGLIPDGADAGAVGTDVVGFQGLGVDHAYSVQLVGGVAGLAAEGDLAGPADDGGGGLGLDSLDFHLAGSVHLDAEILGLGTVQIDLAGSGGHYLNRVLGGQVIDLNATRSGRPDLQGFGLDAALAGETAGTGQLHVGQMLGADLDLDRRRV